MVNQDLDQDLLLGHQGHHLHLGHLSLVVLIYLCQN